MVKIRVEYVTFSLFLLFLLAAGLGIERGITGFSVKDTKENGWVVEFDVREKSDLVIEIVDGSGYSSNDDVEFLDLKCGDYTVIPNILTNKIVYEGYECEEKTIIRFNVNNEGRFKQIIKIGEESRTVSFKR
ncbi:hypothetical protein KY345_05640 [Candidatus Woesearchaeota archaeon]|nr:hypothetical protein [Candidatus Woesearchaeota archaeon]